MAQLVFFAVESKFADGTVLLGSDVVALEANFRGETSLKIFLLIRNRNPIVGAFGAGDARNDRG